MTDTEWLDPEPPRPPGLPDLDLDIPVPGADRKTPEDEDPETPEPPD